MNEPRGINGLTFLVHESVVRIKRVHNNPGLGLRLGYGGEPQEERITVLTLTGFVPEVAIEVPALLNHVRPVKLSDDSYKLPSEREACPYHPSKNTRCRGW
jgi:hypothetical protein